MTPQEAIEAHLKPLAGGKIESGIVDDTEPNRPFYGLRVTNNGKNYNVWVSRDPEGNGPGHLDIEEIQ